MTEPASPPGDRSSDEELVKLGRNLIEALTRELESASPPLEGQGAAARQRLDEVLGQLPLATEGREQVRQHVLDELLGYGPIQPLIDDPEISEIMVNAPDN